MSTFLTLAVYSLKVSSDFPTESRFFPIISIYFIIGIAHTLLSLVWFTISNYTKEKQTKPYWWINSLAGFKTYLDRLISKKIGNMSILKSESEISPVENETGQEDLDKHEQLDLTDLKQKCPNCDICVKCTQKKQKDDSKNDLKKEIDFKCSQVNKIMFSFILFSTLVSYTVIWMIISLNNF